MMQKKIHINSPHSWEKGGASDYVKNLELVRQGPATDLDLKLYALI